jgi:ribose 5-phosphate isomerase B
MAPFEIETISIASDHAGYDLKSAIVEYLISKYDASIVDLGTYTKDPVDYPKYSQTLADKIIHNNHSYGILICGTGIGMSIAANRHRGIRAALCYSPELAELARKHNNANVLVLGARLTDNVTACKIIDIFFQTPFEGGRHVVRLEQIEENNAYTNTVKRY